MFSLHFDHRDPANKKFTIGANTTRPLDEIVAEMEKCDVLCANCHGERTYRERHHTMRKTDGG